MGSRSIFCACRPSPFNWELGGGEGRGLFRIISVGLAVYVNRSTPRWRSRCATYIYIYIYSFHPLTKREIKTQTKCLRTRTTGNSWSWTLWPCLGCSWSGLRCSRHLLPDYVLTYSWILTTTASPLLTFSPPPTILTTIAPHHRHLPPPRVEVMGSKAGGKQVAPTWVRALISTPPRNSLCRRNVLRSIPSK